MTSRIGITGDWPVYAVAHRRGGAVHTFLSTHGTTRRGKDQRHKDDANGEGHAGPPRKCPKVLNDWTKCQPHTDKHNRWRQSILAIEERFRTFSFPFRIFTTLIVGCAAVSTYTGYSYHVRNDTDEDDEDFRDMMETLSVDLMTNTWDEQHSSQPHSERPSTRTAPSRFSHSQHSWAASTSSNDQAHMPVSIAQFKRLSGFAGNSTQRCSVCRVRLTGYCCGHPSCSNEKSIVAICCPETRAKGKIILHPCLAQHRDLPGEAKLIVASIGRQRAASRRKRPRPGR